MIKGFCWHVHHDGLLEWCYSYKERIAHIKVSKPAEEQELRLHLLQPVKGQLPQPLIEAGNAYDETSNAFKKAGGAFSKAWDTFHKAGNPYPKRRDAYEKAGVAYHETRDAYIKARDTYHEALVRYQPEIKALHKLECPDCPWDGTTIFGR